jgi:hypothetical protein
MTHGGLHGGGELASLGLAVVGSHHLPGRTLQRVDELLAVGPKCPAHSTHHRRPAAARPAAPCRVCWHARIGQHRAYIHVSHRMLAWGAVAQAGRQAGRQEAALASICLPACLSTAAAYEYYLQVTPRRRLV